MLPYIIWFYVMIEINYNEVCKDSNLKLHVGLTWVYYINIHAIVELISIKHVIYVY